MKTKLLKQLRAESWNKYEIRNWRNVSGYKDKPWFIGCGEKTAKKIVEVLGENAISLIKSRFF